MNVINVGYDSTNYYALEVKGGKLLVDSGRLQHTLRITESR